MRRLTVAMVAVLTLGGAVACEQPVGPEPGEPVDLSYSPCLGAADVPTWFAYQDGDGAWTRVLQTGNSFDFTLTFGRGGIAFYTDDVNAGLYVIYGSTEELQANLPACSGAVRQVSGSVANFSTLDNVRLWMGVSDEEIDGGSTSAPAAFSLLSVDSDVDDLVAVRSRITDVERFPTSIVIRRAVTGTSTSSVDFGSAEAIVPVQRTVSITNVFAGEEVTVDSYLATRTTEANLARYQPAITQASGPVIAPFYGVSAARLATGETHVLEASTLRSINATTQEGRFVVGLFGEPTDRSSTLGPTLGAISVSGSARPAASYTIQPAYDNMWQAQFGQGSGETFRSIVVVMTKAYLGTSSSVTLAVPNLTGVAGFQSSWQLAAGTPAQWYFAAMNADFSWIRTRALTYQGADRSSTFVP